LREEGYFTFCITNNSFVTRATNAHLGFDVFDDFREPTAYHRLRDRALRRVRNHFGDRLADRLSSNAQRCMVKGDSADTVRRALSLIEQSERPFFGLLILMDTHTPYRKMRTRFARSAPAVRRFLRDHNYRTMWADLMAANSRLPDDMLATALDLYDAEALHADSCLRTLMEALRARGTLDATALIVTADHGEAFGEHGVWGHGFSLNDCLTRVPLVARHPDYWPAGTRHEGIVQLHDLHPTCLRLAGMDVASESDTTYSLTNAGDPACPGREVAFSEFPRQSKTLKFMHDHNPQFDPGVWDHGMWAVRTADWRYVEYENGQCDLYDLNADPSETQSVYEKHPDERDELRARLQAHRLDRPYVSEDSRELQAVNDVVAERLRALGYIE
jgi:arylsulfatase A-like enzyme